MSLRSIAKKLHRSQSSLTRELQRNIKYGNEYFRNSYLPCKAQQAADKRAAKQRQKAPLKNPAIFLYERKTRFTILTKLNDRSAKVKTEALVTRLKEYVRKTLTADNGAENTNHQEIAKTLQLLMYFCHAYHSWEKGTVENTNGRVRRYIPKGVSIDSLTEEYIAALEKKLNNTPRKCLQYQTPYEIIHKLRKASTL